MLNVLQDALISAANSDNVKKVELYSRQLGTPWREAIYLALLNHCRRVGNVEVSNLFYFYFGFMIIPLFSLANA